MKVTHEGIFKINTSLCCFTGEPNIQTKASPVLLPRLNKLQRVDIASLALSVYSAGKSSLMNKKLVNLTSDFNKESHIVFRHTVALGCQSDVAVLVRKLSSGVLHNVAC